MKNEDFPIRRILFHPEIISIDLVKIAQEMTEDQFDEFLTQYDKAIQIAMKNPYLPNTRLMYQLQDWSRIDFFSMKKPPRKFTRDYRFIYRYDADFYDFFKLAVGLRNAKGKQGDSIYYTAKIRLEESPDHWEEENDG
ncbi:MAG: hypothetical protein SOH59_10535 [Heyndrickxia faecalis]|jgi:hypothetical protein|uniref:Uncharacterized protein n=1 Tax=Heyndrickxia coagulans TaxID=1398 RepID=A0A133L186_HEYCO|nr:MULTISPECIES: hypothetical protein [Heyndrickxia]AVD57356.1 hypothetical protein C3766_15395 [Heyndrickxia coagulans]KWZ85651.1 hypothetical protein HMPREF3213_00311 [Heyndrickxia coagulans]MEC2304153.1 hypothetical protein [Weizmannia sp. CD-2023]MEC2339309.1 hypothetical protein [Weizmannia sp. CD-2023]MED4868401.1 hypothetical protein [Weizmannia sp. CD-2023]